MFLPADACSRCGKRLIADGVPDEPTFLAAVEPLPPRNKALAILVGAVIFLLVAGGVTAAVLVAASHDVPSVSAAPASTSATPTSGEPPRISVPPPTPAKFVFAGVQAGPRQGDLLEWGTTHEFVLLVRNDGGSAGTVSIIWAVNGTTVDTIVRPVPVASSRVIGLAFEVPRTASFEFRAMIDGEVVFVRSLRGGAAQLEWSSDHERLPCPQMGVKTTIRVQNVGTYAARNVFANLDIAAEAMRSARATQTIPTILPDEYRIITLVAVSESECDPEKSITKLLALGAENVETESSMTL